jgi:hypothetical protein
MADADADLRPILEMLAIQLRHPHVMGMLADWRGALAKGTLHFGHREPLDSELDFNTLIHTELNPTPSRNGKRITLEPRLTLIGVVSGKSVALRQFHFLRNELVIARVQGRWDYARNDGPYDLSIAPEVTVCLPAGPGAKGRVASRKLLKSVSRLCHAWLAVQRAADRDHTG